MMDKVHVLITAPLAESDIDKVTAVDPSVEVIYAAEEVRVERGIVATEVIPWGRTMGQREITPEEASETLDRMLEHVEVILGWRLPRNLLLRAPRLKWVQGVGAGLDLLAGDTGLLQSDVMLSNASGTNAVAVAEFALCLMLMLTKQVPRFLSSQKAGYWDHYVTAELRGKTVGIVGLGKIGGGIARLSRAFGMRVLGMRRSVRGEQQGTELAGLFSLDGLLQMLPECDFVILAVPLTPDTRKLIGEAALKAMKPTAHIVNIARGPVIDQDILIRALKEGWIAGAALDVFETEPLPPDSELWRLPNVIISPHIAGYVEGYNVAITQLFCENLKRFLNGEQPRNLFDKDRGY
ncbi:MAG: D-2-hydroxyacid dehydrogenase [Chloroflexi bacterium]|nr:D-2-hydroxyacid dehydrogenase [Chloroflexota bacterium]